MADSADPALGDGRSPELELQRYLNDIDELLARLKADSPLAPKATHNAAAGLRQLRDGLLAMGASFLSAGAEERRPSLAHLLYGAHGLYLTAPHRRAALSVLMLTGRFSPEQRDPASATVLHKACLDGGQYEDLRLLLRAGCDPNAAGHFGLTPLALYTGASPRYKGLALLLDAGADPNPGAPADAQGSPPLHSVLVRLASGGLSVDADEGCRIVRLLLDHGARLDAADAEGSTPLHLAAAIEDGRYLALLLGELDGSTGTLSLEARDEQQRTPLHRAAPHPDNVQLLLEAGADVAARTARGDTTLHLAARELASGSLRLLARAGANLSTENSQGRTPLFDLLNAPQARGKVSRDTYLRDHVTTRRHRKAASCALRLLRQGAMLRPAGTGGEARAQDLQTLLYEAVDYNIPLLVGWLVRRGANTWGAPDQAGQRHGRERQPLLHYAAGRDRAGMVRALIRHGADINALSSSGNAPLHEAVLHNRTYCARALLDAGAPLDVRDGDGRTPAEIALLRQKDVLMLQTLLDRTGADPDLPTRDGGTLLHAALSDDRVGQSCARALLRVGADVTLRDPDGRAPLHLLAWRWSRTPAATIQDDTPLCDELLEAGAEIDARDVSGETALMRAVRSPSMRMVNWLLDNGADPNARNGDGLSPLALVAARGYAQTLAPPSLARVVSRLLAAGASLDSLASAQRGDLLCLAVTQGDTGMTARLLALGAPCDLIGGDGQHHRNPLHYAAECGADKAPQLINLLLQAGADTGATDYYKRETPLMTAIRNASPEALSALLAGGAQADESARGALEAMYEDRPEMGNRKRRALSRILAELLSHGLPTGPDQDGRTLMHTLSRDGAPLSDLRVLADTVPDAFTTKDVLGATPIHEYAQQANKGALLLALDHCGSAGLALRDGGGRTPMHDFCHIGLQAEKLSEPERALSLLNALLDGGGDLEIKDDYGNTPRDFLLMRGEPLASMFTRQDHLPDATASLATVAAAT